jgi:cation transport ATPase
MKPIYLAGLLLLALTLALAVMGMVLAGAQKIRLRQAANYCRICTVLVLAAAYFLLQSEWPGVQLRAVDFWSLMLILGIVAYALVWAATAYQLNQHSHQEFGESFMVSMLYSDAERAAQHAPENPNAIQHKVE